MKFLMIALTIILLIINLLDLAVIPWYIVIAPILIYIVFVVLIWLIAIIAALVLAIKTNDDEDDE